MEKREINIYVEGQGEIRFFTEFIAHHHNKKFIITKEMLAANYEDEDMKVNLQVFENKSGNGGIDTKKITNLLSEIREKEKMGISDNFVIIDADTPEHKPAGGYKARIEYLEKRKKEFNINFDFFIIPNYETDGNLEDLLDSMISQNGQPFYNCLTTYIDCLGKLDNDFKPLLLKKNNDLIKTKFEWYSLYMTGDKDSTLKKRVYQNTAWDLDAEKLKPLLSFFDKIFNKS